MKQAQNVEYRAPFEGGARRSVSRVLSRPKAGMAIHLGRSLPNASCDRPERRRERPARRRRHHRHPPAAPTWSCSRWGFPCRPRCRRRGALLPHHFTLAARATPRRGRAWARRYVFCGTIPEVAPAGRYPAPCLRGARTFLPLRHAKSGHPTVWHGIMWEMPPANQRSGGGAPGGASGGAAGAGAPLNAPQNKSPAKIRMTAPINRPFISAEAIPRNRKQPPGSSAIAQPRAAAWPPVMP